MNFTQSLTVSLGIGALGLYLMLSTIDGSSRPMVRRVGASLATASLFLLVILLGGRNDVAANSAADSSLFAFVFLVLVCTSLIAAVLTITSRRTSSSLLWFAVLLLSNSGLMMLYGAPFLAAMTVLLYAGMLFVTWVFLVRFSEQRTTSQPDRFNRADHFNREPLLSCLAGVLLSVSLIGAIHYAVGTESRSHPENRRPTQRGSPDKTADSLNAPDNSPIPGFGAAMYETVPIGLVITAVLLLVSVVGAALIVQQTGNEQRSGEG